MSTLNFPKPGIRTNARKLGQFYRRRLFELLGNDRYSQPALQNLDQKLVPYLPERGFFIEAGANDGFSQSNTYYLERIKKWTGILIEPIPVLFTKCVKERPSSKVYNYALVPQDYPDTEVAMEYGHLMSMVKGGLNDPEQEALHLKQSRKYYSIKNYEVRVPARTLTSILDESNVTSIDFFSLDVEGFELSVLKGLDLDRYQPKFMLIEHLTEASKVEIEAYLSKYYHCVAHLSQYDYLYQLKSA